MMRWRSWRDTATTPKSWPADTASGPSRGMRVPRFGCVWPLHTGKAYNIEPGVQTAVASAPEAVSVRVWQITSGDVGGHLEGDGPHVASHGQPAAARTGDSIQAVVLVRRSR